MEPMIQHKSHSRRTLRSSTRRLLRPSHPYRRVSYVDPMYLKHDDSLGDLSGFLKAVALLPPLHDQLDSRDAQLYKRLIQPGSQGDVFDVAEPELELEGRRPGRIVGKFVSILALIFDTLPLSLFCFYFRQLSRRRLLMLITLFILVVALWLSDS
ncbi:hypothetical protein K435DRAFT_473061 [Dendrothele bispora CBS 962.96]|uniref:Uncharacterized protein n=1 Tax=Dendrothele bispora (strain CBS 962.96) TaxID=1314807 RepID=A0A4S8MBQ3_DENBC|nr:hypothetical protein K435DRAFT_473061 [Dendrothele bispora CBS 962.96]